MADEPQPPPQNPVHQTLVLTDPPPEKHHTLLYTLCVAAVALVTGGIVFAYWQLDNSVTEVPTEVVQEEVATTTSQNSERITLLDQRERPVFYKDVAHVWILGEMPPEPILIVGADPQTFMPLIYPYSKDITSAFCWDRQILSADVKSFEVIEREDNSADNLYARDKNAVYHCTRTVVGADLSTFKAVNNPNVGYDAEDKNYAYHWGEIWGEIVE